MTVLGLLVDDTPENALRWMAEQGAWYPTVRELLARLDSLLVTLEPEG